MHLKRILWIVLLMIPLWTNAQNWPQFRGSGAAGVSDGQQLPESWDVKSGTNIKWKAKIPVVAHSSPVIWGDRVYINTTIGNEQNWHDDKVKHAWRLYAFDKHTGKELWNREATSGIPRTTRHEKASQSNSTPVTDGKVVASIFASEGLYVYTVDGKLLWKKDLGLLDPGLAKDPTSQWGHASSPILYKNLLIVQCDKHADSYLAAFKISDGSEAWRVARTDELPSWSTPTIYEGKNRTELIVNGQYVRAYDPMTGKELWRFADQAQVKQPTPFLANGVIIATGGYPKGRPIYALKTGANGDISGKPEHVTYVIERGGPYTPTPIVYRDLLYAVQNNGTLIVHDAKSGEKKFEAKLNGEFSASPIASDGKVYFASEDGKLSVVKAVPQFELAVEIDMGSPMFATPAISDKMLFVRTLDQLYAIGK